MQVICRLLSNIWKWVIRKWHFELKWGFLRVNNKICIMAKKTPQNNIILFSILKECSINIICHLMTVSQREKRKFSLGYLKSTVLGGRVDIFANNMVISPWRDKHACVCLLIPHKRVVHLFALIHKQRQTFSLLCRLLSFLFYFPLPLWAKKQHTCILQQAWRSSDHTQGRISLTLFSSFPSYVHTF